MSYGQEPSELRRVSSGSWPSKIQPCQEQGHGWSVLSFQPGDGLTRLLLNLWVVIRVYSWLFVNLKSLTVEQTWSTDVPVSTPSSFRGPDVSFPARSFRRFRLEGCLLAPAWQRQSEPHICTSSGFPPPHPRPSSPNIQSATSLRLPGQPTHRMDGGAGWGHAKEVSLQQTSALRVAALVLPLGTGRACCKGL